MTWYITSIVGCASEPLRNSLEEYIESVDREFAKHATYSDGTAYAIWMTALNRVREINIRVKEHDAAIAAKARREERERLLEPMEDLRKFANGEYNEADASDNEREMRIHLEYENRIWDIMKSLREGAK